MDYSVSPKLQELRPTDGEQLRAYMNKIKESNRIKDFYIDYGVEYVDSIKITYYVEEKVNLLTVEYTIPDEEKESGVNSVRLTIAKNQDRMGSFAEVKKVLNDFFQKTQKYATTDSVSPEIYVAKLQKMGWTFTPEGLDMMQVSKTDGIKQIRKTEFGQSEYEKLTQEDVEQNRKKHVVSREKELIETLENYLIEKYKLIPDSDEELKEYKEKILKYDENKRIGIQENSSDLLVNIFKELKPIEEPVTILPVMQKSFNANIRAYIDRIPSNLREPITQIMLNTYIRIRERAISEREEGVLQEGSETMEKLYSVVKVMDENEETKAREARNELVHEANLIFDINLTNIKNATHDDGPSL